MLSPYRAIFDAPGAKGFCAAAFVSRMPMSMLGIGIVTMISQLTGTYRLAGALSATLALSIAAVGPQLSRLVDRFGQRRVTRPAIAITVVAVTGLLIGATVDAPAWTLFACAAASGATPSMGALVRARWAHLYAGTPNLHTAYSLESVVDEMCFIVGPILAIGLSTSLFPAAGPLLAMCFLAVGGLAFTAQRSTEPPPHPRTENTGPSSAIRIPGLRVLTLTFAVTGAIFGAMDVITVAFAEEHGHKTAASLILAIYSAGSCLSGIAVGLVKPAGNTARRFLLGVSAMAVSMVPLLLATNLPSLAAMAFVAGLSIAPTMVAAMALVAELVPRANLTEGMTWTNTGVTVGVAAGSSAAGWVVDAAGAHTAFLVPVAAGSLAMAVAFAGSRWIYPNRSIGGICHHAPAVAGAGGATLPSAASSLVQGQIGADAASDGAPEAPAAERQLPYPGRISGSASAPERGPNGVP